MSSLGSTYQTQLKLRKENKYTIVLQFMTKRAAERKSVYNIDSTSVC